MFKQSLTWLCPPPRAPAPALQPPDGALGAGLRSPHDEALGWPDWERIRATSGPERSSKPPLPREHTRKRTGEHTPVSFLRLEIHYEHISIYILYVYILYLRVCMCIMTLYYTARCNKHIRDRGSDRIWGQWQSQGSVNGSVTVSGIDIIKSRRCIERPCLLELTSHGAAILDRSTAPLSVIHLAGAITVHLINETSLNTKQIFTQVFFAAKVIHVAMIQDTWFVLF